MLIWFAALRTSCPSLLGADLLKDRFEDPQRTNVVKENFIPGMFSVKRCAWSCLCEWSHRGGAGCEMISEKGMVGQRGRELQVISPWVGPTVAQVRTGNIRLVLGCVWRKTLDGGRGVCSKHPPRQAENGACSGMSIFLLFFSLGFFYIPYSLHSSPPGPWDLLMPWVSVSLETRSCAHNFPVFPKHTNQNHSLSSPVSLSHRGISKSKLSFRAVI